MRDNPERGLRVAGAASGRGTGRATGASPKRRACGDSGRGERAHPNSVRNALRQKESFDANEISTDDRGNGAFADRNL